MNESIIEERTNWYKNATVLYQMLMAGLNREIVIMNRLENWKCSRGNRIRYMNELKDHIFKIYGVAHKDDNIYISLAQYKEIPQFTFNLHERSNETSVWFNNRSFKDIIAYDLLIDTDCKEGEEKQYLKEIQTLLFLFSSENIKFRIIFSGTNYQFVIPSEIWGFIPTNTQTINKAKDFLYQLQNRFLLKYIDLVGAGVHNKIMKMPYSCVYDKVVLPVHNFFSSDFYRIVNVYKAIVIKNRGLMYFNNDKTNEDFKKFCYKYLIDM